ncbi:serine protease grass [Drosophila eugracilis]|uniref:serine protease grass n=1 Tax=Drosophila eugracilis TaxID=29029 RepID=UPI0007E870A7|nr:serine protease grass [Drosophila eugracilis]
MRTSLASLVICLIFQQMVESVVFLNPTCGVSYEPFLGPRIMNGKDAVLRSAPFMAYLYNATDLFCGGSIINSRYILTAAHCIFPRLKVRLGEHDTNSNPDCQGPNICSPRSEEYEIQMASRHAYYDESSIKNDIAVIKLTRNIRFNIHIQPICLILNPANSPRVNEYIAFGWGSTAFARTSNVLQTTVLKPYSRDYCNGFFGSLLTRNQICAGFDNRDTCKGDSGGPLVAKVNLDGVNRYLQLGIVSYGPNKCMSPGVYTFVPNYIDWIKSSIRINGN